MSALTIRIGAVERYACGHRHHGGDRDASVKETEERGPQLFVDQCNGA